MFLYSSMNEFAYGQALLLYKDDIEKISKNHIFEQDGVISHTSKLNLYILNKLFPYDGWIQNPTNSPDLAYPIEEF